VSAGAGTAGASPELAAFAELAERFCAVVEGVDGFDGVRSLTAIHSALPRLYATAMELPTCPPWADTAPDDSTEESHAEAAADEAEDYVPLALAGRDPDRVSHEEWMALFRRLGACFRDHDYYRLICDPYDGSEKEVSSSLSEDVSDIYGDLLAGLRKWRRGDRARALESWRCDFEIHWGAHAVQALAALQALARAEILPWPAKERP
jgi:hypothetical protein